MTNKTRIISMLLLAFTMGGMHGKRFNTIEAATQTYYAGFTSNTSACGATPACSTAACPCKPATAISKFGDCTAGDDCILNFVAGTYYIGDPTVFSTDVIDITKSGSNGHPFIVQANGWTAIGAKTQDEVIIDLTRPLTTGTWTRCSTCPAGGSLPTGTTCPGVPASVCTDTWYATNANTTSCGQTLEGALNSNGELSYAVNSFSQLTNNHSTIGFDGTSVSAYNSSRCSGQTWRPCKVDSDCNSGQTCTINISPEQDTLTCNPATHFTGCAFSGAPNEAWIYGVWGSTLPSHPYVISKCVGNAFRMTGTVGYVEIRGFIVKDGRSNGIAMLNGTHDITIKDNIITTMAGESGFNAYGICLCSIANPLTAISNEIMYTMSEAIHTRPLSYGAASVRNLQNNYIHDIGNSTITGYSQGTPTCFTLDSGNRRRCDGGTNDGGDCSSQTEGSACSGGGTCLAAAGLGGNYTGSVIEGNLFKDHWLYRLNSSGGFGGTNTRCLNFENDNDGWVIRNNIFNITGAECMIFDPTSSVTGHDGSANNNEIYNNILLNCNYTSSGSGAIKFAPATGLFTNSNLIYNNTIVNSKLSGFYMGSTGSTGNIFRNNIIYSNAPTQQFFSNIDLEFDNNLVFDTGRSTNLISINGVAKDCSNLDTLQTGNICDNPGFYDTTRYLFYPMGGANVKYDNVETNASFNPPTLDAGTATGMPAGKTAGIVNTLAAAHGFGYYSDSVSQGGAAWDIGAVESLLSYGNTPVGWTGYTPTGCSGGAATNPGTDGAGFVFRTQRDPSTLCNGVSTTMTLTVGQQYFVYFREKAARSIDDITVDASTPPNYAIATSSTCGNDKVDDWSLDASNATISEVRYGSTNPNRGDFDTVIPHVFLLTPTSASVTLKAQVKSGGIFLTCPDTVYFFDPIVVVPIKGHCSTTQYRSCDPNATPNTGPTNGCPAGESCS